ncbi:MAG: hypothetical protein ABWX96_20410 [Propionibacteriaceae bacterium]
MTESEATETEHWRLLSREVQGLATDRQIRAQAIVDIAESVKRIAGLRGTDPLDDLLELHARVSSAAAKQMVADCLCYVRVEPLLAVRTS